MKIADFIGFSRDIGTRFTLVGVIPTAILELFVLALVWSGAPGHSPDLDKILTHARALDAWSGGLLLLVLIVAALLIEPFQFGLVRVLEGYWGAGPLGSRIAAWVGKRSLKRVTQMEQELEPQGTPEAMLALVPKQLKRDRLYPPSEDDLMPTRLGNALRSGERRAGLPYGLDAVVIWPRLYPLLPEGTRALVADQRDQLDLSARFCATFLAAAVISLALLWQYGWWLAVPAACLVLAWFAYQGAIAGAVAYGEGMRTAVDLHRFDLLTTLHLPLPANLAVERRTNRQLTEFLLQDRAVDFTYSHDGNGAAPIGGYDPWLGEDSIVTDATSTPMHHRIGLLPAALLLGLIARAAWRLLTPRGSSAGAVGR